jgi:putative oxidoreductase
MRKKTPMKKTSAEKVAMPAASTKQCMCGSCGTDCGRWGLMLLRIVVGAAFLFHGVTKLMNLAGTMTFFQSVAWFGWLGAVVAIVEAVGGLALILGIFTRWASYALAVIMVGALVLVSGRAGVTAMMERDVLLLASLLALAWNGPGKWSLHDKCGCCGDCC